MAKRKNGSGSNFAEQLSALREKIAATRTERRRVEQAPCSIEEAEARIREWVEALASPYIHRSAFTSAVVYDRPKLVGDDPEVFAAFHFADRIIEKRLELARADLEQRGPGIAAEDRAARLDELDADAAALEREEEDLVRSGEELGLEVDRRPDALPEVVLIFDPEKRTYDLPRLRSLEVKLRRFQGESRAIEEERELLRSKLRDAQWRVREVEDDLAPHAPRADAEKLRREAREGLERAEAQKARLAEEYAGSCQRARRVGALVQACRDFLREQGIERDKHSTLTHTRASAGMPT